MHSYVILLCIVHLVYFTQLSVSADAASEGVGADKKDGADSEEWRKEALEKVMKIDTTKDERKKKIKPKSMISEGVGADKKDGADSEEWRKEALEKVMKIDTTKDERNKKKIKPKSMDNYKAGGADSEEWRKEALEKVMKIDTTKDERKKKKVKPKSMVNNKAGSLEMEESLVESSSEDKDKEKGQDKNKGPEWTYLGHEQMSGHKSDLSHSNPKYKLTQHFDLDNLGRRHDTTDLEDLDVLAEEHLLRSVSDQDGDKLIPVKASPEFVLSVVNATRQTSNSSFSHLVSRDALRTSDFFDGAWAENISPAMLRTGGEPETPITLEAVKVKVYAGSRLHEIVDELRKISPQLLYVINKQ